VQRWTVGALARQAGVSPGLLRHYDRLGLLRPTSTSGAGYRLYTEQDRARLELVRALRALDFDLDTIGRLLAARSSVRSAAELHLHTLDLQARVIGRRRAVLRVLLRGNAAELVSDPDFLARHRGRTSRHEGAGENDASVWMSDMRTLYGPAAAAAREQVDSTSEAGRAIVRRWMRGIARSRGMPPRRDGRAAARDLLQAIEAGRDPREERFWQLVGILKTEIARSPMSVAWPWLMEGLRVLVATTNRERGSPAG
jgi:DNA-binding transcriptional MerR regulator